MLIYNELYKEDIHSVAVNNINWEYFKEKSILITGASGLIGNFLIDILMYRNINFNNKITIFAVSRNQEKAFIRFKDYFNSAFFNYINKDLLNNFDIFENIDFIIHGASNSHPIAYSSEPINTVLLSILGTNSILKFAYEKNVKRTIFLSTVEIYGENCGDVEEFSEDYCGYIDCNTLRACYNEGKRAAEALCQAYINENNIDIVIARCCRVFGPTMSYNDSKVISQFIKNAVNNENITLKSNGQQLLSFAYVADICSALLFLFINGVKGNAYNVANTENVFSLYDIAVILSSYTGKNINFDTPSSLEATGFSNVTKSLLNCKKIFNLGWKPSFSIKNSLIKTINILKNNNI